MKRLPAKQLWVWAADESPQSLEKDLAKLAESLPYSYLCSGSKQPRSTGTCVVGMSWVEANRVARLLRAGDRSKAALKATKSLLADEQATRKAQAVDHEAAMDSLRKDIEALNEALSLAEKNRDLAQRNVDTLSRNLGARSSSDSSQPEKPTRGSGMAKLAELGAHGPALSGGLPGLGKRR